MSQLDAVQTPPKPRKDKIPTVRYTIGPQPLDTFCVDFTVNFLDKTLLPTLTAIHYGILFRPTSEI